MSTAYIQGGYTPSPFDIGVRNNSATAIPAGYALQLDTSLPIDNAGVSSVYVKLPTTGEDPSRVVGVSLTTIPAYGQGVMRAIGPIVEGLADTIISAGGLVDASATNAGSISAHTSAKNSVGVALATAAVGDTIPYILSPDFAL